MKCMSRLTAIFFQLLCLMDLVKGNHFELKLPEVLRYSMIYCRKT